MNTKYIEIIYNGEVVIVAKLQEGSAAEFVAKSKEAKVNLERLLGGLLDKVAKLEKDVKVLKGED